MKLVKKVIFSSVAITLLFALSGCVQMDKSGNPHGLVYDILAKPMVQLIEFFSKSIGYGWGIVLITVIVRLIIFPLGISQSRKMLIQQEKMNYLKPVLEPLQQKVKNATSREEQAAAQIEMQKAYKENGVNMLGGIGCLPLLIQMPIFSALYVAVRYTPGILKAPPFFGINLNEVSIALVVIVAIFYLGQSFVSMIGVSEEQKKQMRTMTFVSPIMMIFFTFSSPGGVALYWAVGGVFAILQTLYTNVWMKPKLRAAIEEEFKKNPIKAPIIPKKDVTESVAPPVKQLPKNPTTGRNAGKQNRKR